MNTIRVMNMCFLNSAPYRVLARDARVDYQEGSPAACAAALLQNDVDVALLPQASIFKHGFYDILPYGTVATGAIRTAMLFHERPLEELNEVLLDSSSETSVLLLRTLFAEFYTGLNEKIRFRIERPERVIAKIGGRTAGFVIGDRGFRLSTNFPYQSDLATLWIKHTGLPFLFASWAYKPGALSAEQAALFCNILKEGLRHRALFARDYAEEVGLDRDSATDYVSQTVEFEITEEVRHGASRFCELAAKYNFLPGETAFGELQIFDPENRTEIPFVATRKRPLIDSALDDATAYRRLSVSSATLLARTLPLSELLLLTALRKHSRKEIPPERIFRLPMTRTLSAGTPSLIAPQEFQRIVEPLPRDALLLLEATPCDELSLESLRMLLESGGERLQYAAFSLAELQLFANEEHVELEEIFERVQQLGIQAIDARTPELFSIQKLDWALQHLESFRSAARIGLRFVSRVQVELGNSLEEFAIHLFHLRQLQEHTAGLQAHFVEWPARNSVYPAPLESVEQFARVFALSQLLLDNVPNIALSPLGYGAPMAEVLVELGADSIVTEL